MPSILTQTKILIIVILERFKLAHAAITISLYENQSMIKYNVSTSLLLVVLLIA